MAGDNDHKDKKPKSKPSTEAGAGDTSSIGSGKVPPSPKEPEKESEKPAIWKTGNLKKGMLLWGKLADGMGVVVIQVGNYSAGNKGWDGYVHYKRKNIMKCIFLLLQLSSTT